MENGVPAFYGHVPGKTGIINTLSPNRLTDVSSNAKCVIEPVSALKLLKAEETSNHRPRLSLLLRQLSNISSKVELFRIKLGITEISGEAGTGKTQMGLGLCVSCAAFGFRESTPSKAVGNKRSVPHNPYLTNGSSVSKQVLNESNKSLDRQGFNSIYVSLAEGGETSILNRLQQMATSRFGSDAKTILSRVLVKSIPNEDEFHALINEGLPFMLSNRKTGVIVLDSIGALFRFSDNEDAGFFYKRSMIFFKLAAKLKMMSDMFSVPIIIINQVTGTERGVIPALGLSWSNCVNTRFLLTRWEKNEEGKSMFLRFARVMLSSSMQEVTVQFDINRRGCQAIDCT